MYSDWSSLCAAVSALDESLTTVTQFIINNSMIVSQTLQNKVPIKIVSNGPCDLMRSDSFTGSFFKPEAALSIGGNNKITLDGNNVEANGSIIDVTTDISLEVTNCDFKWAKSIYDGGAISVTSNKTNPAIIKIQNSDFIRNHSTANNANGGALYFTYNCTATLDNCNIKNNDCKSNGGAIAIESNSCDVTINNCVIQSNCINNDNGQGGGIYLYKGKLRLFNTDVSQNNKSKSGNNINYAQDIYFYNMGNPTLTLNGENNVTNIEYEIASSATSLNTIKLENDTILTNYMTFRIKFTSTSGISLTEAAIVEWKDTSKTFTETDFNNFILDSTVKDYELVLSDDKKSINIKKKDGS